MFVVAGSVVAGGACPGRVEEPRDGELLFLIEYMTICQQIAVFATVPWALAYAVAASMVCVLASWVRTQVARTYSMTMHMLTFHFCLNVSCVMEFRTDADAPLRNSFLPKIYGDEAFAHKLSVLQAILDFVCIHLIINVYVCVKGERDWLGPLGLAGYRAEEVVYGCVTYLFLLCWLMQHLLEPAAFECLLVGCTLLIQWYTVLHCGAVDAGAEDAGAADAGAAGAAERAAQFSERATTLVGLFSDQHFEALLGTYVVLNVLGAVVFTEQLWEPGRTAEEAALSTGPEFWLLV